MHKFNAGALSKLIAVVFGPDRRAAPLPRWPAAPRLAEEPDGRTPPEVAQAAPRLAEVPDGRTPPEVAQAAPRLAEVPDGRKPPEVAPAVEERSDATGVA